jgi:cyanate permease
MLLSRWMQLFGVWMLYGSFGLVATSLAPLAALIIDDLSMTHGEMGFVMGAWQLVYIGAAIPAGILLDKLGARRALLIGGMLVGFSALARAWAFDTNSLILAVMIFGLGGPIISAGAPKVVVSLFEGSSRGLAMGIYMTGPALGGIVSLTATHPFLLPLMEGDWRGVLTLWGGVTFAASALWFLIASIRVNMDTSVPATGGPSQLRVIGNLLGKPTVLLVLAMSICVFLFNHGLMNWLPELLRSHGMTATQAGYWAALPTVVGIMGSLMIPRLASPERRFYILIGLSISALAASLLLRAPSEPALLSGLLLQGLARSSLMTLLILTLVELPEIGEKYAGVASGIFFTAAEVGGVLGPLMLGLLYLPGEGFGNGLWLLTGVAVIMVAGTGWLQRKAGTARRT